MRSPASATNVLILLIALAFVVSNVAALPPGYLGFSTAGLLQGRVWTLLTSIFTHVNTFHVAVNVLFLYVFGNALENKVGAARAVSVFFLGGIAGLIVGIPFYSPDTTIVGSSIAVSALLGAVIVLNPEGKSSPLFLFLPLGLVALIWVIFNAFMLLYDQSGGVAWPSHVIGFFIGVVLGVLWRETKEGDKSGVEKENPTFQPRQRRRRW